jgi:hypothetical protein
MSPGSARARHAALAPGVAAGDTRAVALAVSVDQLPEMVYHAPRVALGYEPPSDVLVVRGTWSTTQHWWIDQDGERAWLTSRQGHPDSVPRPSESRVEALPHAAHKLGDSRVTVRALPDRSPPSRHDVALASDRTAPGHALIDLIERRVELSALVAANVSAPAALLERLGRGRDRATLEALAGNPSASFATLLRLAPVFPGAFWGNPQVLLLLFTDPSFGAMSDYTLAALLSHPAAPVQMVQAFASHRSAAVREFVRRALAAREP